MSYAITPSTRGVKIRPTVLGKLVWGSHRQSVVKKKKKIHLPMQETQET